MKNRKTAISVVLFVAMILAFCTSAFYLGGYDKIRNAYLEGYNPGEALLVKAWIWLGVTAFLLSPFVGWAVRVWREMSSYPRTVTFKPKGAR
jgi:hypothetical protein